MINKKRVVLSVLCLLLLVFGVFSFSACKNEVENFNLSFKVNGETYQTITTSGDEAIAIPENPTKEGYTFDGWYWDKDVWSKPFTANSLMDAPISSDMSVYAKFSAIKYDITYENDGGTHSNPVSYTIEDSFALPAAEKIGYTFVGWYSDSAYTTKVESVSAGSTGAITLYAKFEINNYTISYGNTKDVANNNVTGYNVNTDTITLSDLSKTGYVFEGWYNGEEKVTEIAKGSTGDITLTAKWSVIGYEITYHNVDGATNSNSETYDVEDQPLALSDASEKGYRFLGWYTDAACTNKVTEIAIGTTGDINLYAKWELIEYTATFMDGNTEVGKVKFTVESESITEPAFPEHVGYTGAWEGYTLGTEDITVNAVYSLISYNITYNNVTGATNSNPATYDVEDQTLTLVDASKNYYTFKGWYSDAAFTNKVTEISVGATGDVTLYAKWEAIEYTATFVDGDTEIGTVKFTVETESITEPAVPEHVGYTGAWESYTLGTEDITINAVYTLIPYGITYNNVSGATNNNPANYDVEDQPLALLDASKNYYTFKGWYSDAAFTNKVTEISVGMTGDVTLYAKWEAIEYTATFMDGDTEVGSVKFTVESESITEPAVPNHMGYTGAWENYTLGTEDITVNAVYSLVTYGITYNNVTGAMNSNPATYDVEDQPLILVDASKNYYTFKGWYSDAAFTNKVTEISVGATGDVTLYAKWEAIEYTATFMDGDTEVGSVKFTVESESITEPAVPNHMGYTGAWENYTLGTKDITINAVYSLVTYGITYNNVIGAMNSNPATYDVEDQPLILVDASKAHYTFLGWYTDAAFTNKVTEISVGTTGDVTLYARWDAVEYTITFLYDNEIGDYAEGTVVKTIYTVEDEFEFATLVCKTVGYTFDGWFTEKNVGTGTKVTGVTKGTSGNITVYARFGLEEYDITYNNVNGATNNNPTHYNAASEDFTIYPLTKEGYTFDGWFADEKCTISANLTITKGSNGDITFYAKWTPIPYTIEYVTYGGTATGNPATYIVTDNVTFNDATLSGYVFKGWYTAAEGGNKVTEIVAGTTGNIILYAHWDYVSTITFNSNGGSAVAPISNVEGTAITAPVAPTKEHYTFAGWYSDVALKTAYSFEAQPSEDITLYAKWTPVVYDIEYVLNGGTNSSKNVKKYTVEDKVELYAPSKVGYDFIGWFTDAEFTSSVVTELKVGTSGKITLYAHYSVNQYTISFESNGGTSVSAITQNYATNVTAPEAPSKNGYTFAGWYSNASLTSKYAFSTMPADNITLYAKWNLETYNITYNLNGGTNNSSNPATYTITSAKITLKDPTKTGYRFAGWYTDAECTEAITEIASGSYGVVELFAKWTATEYTITYVTADEATHSNILTYTIETDLTTLADATLKGHAFGGWYTDDSYATAVTTVAGGEIGNKTVYAKFTANTYTVWLDGNEEASCVVSFNLNGADGTITSQTVTPTATLKYPTVPTRDGYIFAGWYDNENCTGSLYDFTAVVTSDTMLYAKWVKVENAASIAINGSSNITLNGKYEQMLMFVPPVSGNITITASGIYDTFGVLYNSEMMVLAQDDDDASDGINFLIVYNVTAGETYYIGARAFSSTTMGTATVNISGNNTVLDGGYTITASKGTAKYGHNFTFNVPEARDGYKFIGYADENGVMYTDENGNSVKIWDKDFDTTLYSVWERTIYTITFETSGGTTIESVQLEYGARINIDNYKTARSGWYLDCWMLDDEEFNATTMPDRNITLVAKWLKDTVGAVKCDDTITAISIYDEISAEFFDVQSLTSGGNKANISFTISGKQEAGEVITITFVASYDGITAKKQKSITVSVYGDPTLIFDNSIDYVNVEGGMTAKHFGASGQDSFGNSTEIKVYIDGEDVEGKYVTVTIASIDPAGNTTYGYVYNVKAYGLPKITYNETKNAISVNDTISPELFNAIATDSFGENLAVTVSRYSGTISAGRTVTIRISAKDSKGNIRNIDVLCKVYSAPKISDPTTTNIKESDSITADLLGITAKDTYNSELDIDFIIKSGSQLAGTEMIVTAKAVDIAGNVTTKDFSLKVYGTPTIIYDKNAIKVTDDLTKDSVVVNFNLNGGSGTIASQTVTAESGISYPSTIPTRSGYSFTGWYTSPTCTTLYDFSENLSEDITLYAGWKAMVSSGYSTRKYISIYGKNNSASSYSSVSTSGTYSSNAAYTYFTALEDGIYTLYYRNGGSDSEIATYIYVYNETQNMEILASTKITSTEYASISFSANAGDVIYVRNKQSSQSWSCTFYMYVKGGNLPESGGILENASIIGAQGYDSFGNPLIVNITNMSGSLIGGNYVKYTLETTDGVGNTYVIDTSSIGVYDVSEIVMTHGSKYMSDMVRLASDGVEFNVVATDSFGNNCIITVEAANGSALIGGTTVNIVFVATDAAGNRYVSEAFPSIKIYDMPTVDDVVVYEHTDISSMIVVRDSFGVEIYSEVSWTGTQIAGEYVEVTVFAEDDAGNILSTTYTYRVVPSDYVYTLKEDGTYELTSYSGTSSSIEILSNLNGKAVTSIADNAFKNKTSITTVVIPDSIISIGANAFYGCTGLTSVTIGEGETNIGNYCFYGCTRLTSVTMGSNVSSIGDYAFYNCTKLTSIKISDSVTSIGSYAFNGCTKLASVTIGENVTTIGNYAFYKCTALENIYFNALAMKDLKSTNNVFYNAGYYGDGINLVIGKNVTRIPAYLFEPYASSTSYQPKLISVEFEEGSICKSVGSHAFTYCSTLEKVYIPDLEMWCNLSIADRQASLMNNNNVNLYLNNAEIAGDIIIPSTVTQIPMFAFYKCELITSVTIPNSVTSMGEYAFANCVALKSVSLSSNIKIIDTYAFNSCTLLSNIVIPSGVTRIEDGAFQSCTGITAITLPDSLTSIGDYAFYGCTGITSVIIPDAVTYIGEQSFRGCTSLTKVTIGSSVDRICAMAFYECTKLTSVTFKNRTGWYYAPYGFLTSGETGTSISSSSLSSTSTAAKYLTQTYGSEYNRLWYRKTT